MAARVDYPGGTAVDPEGNLFIADTLNCRVRKVTLGDSAVTTLNADSRWRQSHFPSATELLTGIDGRACLTVFRGLNRAGK